MNIDDLLKSWEDEYRRYSQLLEHGEENLTKVQLVHVLLRHCDELRELRDEKN